MLDVKNPIGENESKDSRIGYVFCIENCYTGGKFRSKFWRAKMGGGCWRYREPIERDESRE